MYIVPKHPPRFLVITTGRSGSNYLMSLLNSHPEINARGEFIGQSRLRRPWFRTALRLMGLPLYLRLSLMRRHKPIQGIKALYNQLEPRYADRWQLPGLNGVREFLVANRNLRVIHLIRRNRLKTLASARVAAATSSYLSSDASAGPAPVVELEIERCERRFIEIGMWEDLNRERFQAHPYLEIVYEEFVANQDEACAELLAFLGASAQPLVSPLVKQARRPLSETIANYGELRDHFAGSEWSRYFESD